MRPLTAYLDLSALVHNYLYLKKLHGKQVFAVVKADAYGHGAVMCAKTLDAYVDGFAVAFLEEATELREEGVNKPILLLEGVFCASDYSLVEEKRLLPVIQNEAQLKWFLEYSWKKPITVWLKMDTGMRRAGFMPKEFLLAEQLLKADASVAGIVEMTHLCCADLLDNEFTEQQLNCFTTQSSQTANLKSICNSAGVLYHPRAYQDIARVGIAMYGINPIATTYSDKHLKPVMHLYSKIFSVKLLRRGEKIGYGGIFTAPYDMRIGLVACGYADGYPRVPSQDNCVWIDQVKSRIIGRVSMDMLSVELNRPQQGIGSQVELWGAHISVNEIALRANTISYELLSHNRRAKRVYCPPTIY
ncbi:MAG: alanine racemase [Neisseriaceae bacterium]